MLPPRQSETTGGVVLTESGQRDFFYGLVVSVGELAFDKHVAMMAGIRSMGGTVAGGARDQVEPVKEGDIVVFDQVGHRPVQLATIGGEMNRFTRVIYSQLDAILDDDTIEQHQLHDFADERKLLENGDLRTLYASA